MPFESRTGSYIGDGMDVYGVGTVELPTVGPGAKRSTIYLEEVLYVPDALCNILGGGLGLYIDTCPTESSQGRLYLEDRRVVGQFRPDEDLLVVQLGDPPAGTRYGPSPFQPGVIYIINATWTEGERRRYRESVAGQPAPPSGYSPAEKRWLKDNYGGEYKFLRSYGLSIYKEEDRDEGAAIVRGLIANDEA